MNLINVGITKLRGLWGFLRRRYSSGMASALFQTPVREGTEYPKGFTGQPERGITGREKSITGDFRSAPRTAKGESEEETVIGLCKQINDVADKILA